MSNFYNNQQQYGTYYAPQQRVEMNQALTPEEEAILKQERNTSMSFKLDQVDALTGICTHKSTKTKLPDITPLGGTRVRCNICGEEFDIIDDPSIFNTALDIVISGLQTIKTEWIDIPTAMAREYFTIIPLLKKAPTAFQMAKKCWNNYQESKEVNNASGFSTLGMWNMLAGGAYNPYAPQPGFGYAPQAPAPGYAPQAPGYGYAPQAPAPGYGYQQPGYDAYGRPMQPENAFVNPNVAPQQQEGFTGGASAGYAPGLNGTAANLGNQQGQQQNNQQQVQGQQAPNTSVVNGVEISRQITTP